MGKKRRAKLRSETTSDGVNPQPILFDLELHLKRLKTEQRKKTKEADKK